MLSSLAAETSIGDFLSGVLILMTALLRLGSGRVQAALGGVVVGVLQAQEVGDQGLGPGRWDHFDALGGTKTGRQLDRLVGRLAAGDHALGEEEFVGRHTMGQRIAADLRLWG